MSEKKRRCVGCMREIDDAKVCPYCGYDDSTPISKDYLTPRFLLQDRYLIGKPLRYNGEGVSYIALDTDINHIVEVREYFPDKLCVRATDGSQDLIINVGFEAQFKALMVDFAEMCETLISMRTLTNIQQVYDVFEENNTMYAVKEYVSGITLTQYLQDNAGDLDWDQAQKLFLPLLKNIAMLHGYKVLHRGISPDNLRVTKHEELKLCDFCISSVRNIKSEISPQIYMGYAAPEQLSPSASQGTWTDVYGVCAVLYRSLTGARPPEANTRGLSQSIIPVNVLNQSVPQPVSDAILKGLSFVADDRTKTVGVLLSEIGSEVVSPPVTQIVETPKKERPKRYGFLALGITAGILVLIGIFIIFFALSDSGKSSSSDLSSDTSESSVSEQESSSLSSSSSSSSSALSVSGTTYVMPTLAGQTLESVNANANYADIFSLNVTEVYDDKNAKGVIIEQDVKPGSINPPQTKVNIKVSKGKQYPTIPSFTGMSKDAYLSELDTLNIPYTIATADHTGGNKKGSIVSVDPGPGTVFDRESGGQVTVTIAQ